MGDGSAIIVFKSPVEAAAFSKKYQRKMIDLSLINVTLVPKKVVTVASKAVA